MTDALDKDEKTIDQGQEVKAVISKTKDDSQASFAPRALIKFNVGGRFFETTHATLMNCPHSVLAQTCSAIWGRPPELVDDRIFIDRNGERFQDVLDFCRELEIPEHTFDTPKNALGLWKEARYYGLDDLQQGIESHYGHCKHCGIWKLKCDDIDGPCDKNTLINHAILQGSICLIEKLGVPYLVRARIDRVDIGRSSSSGSTVRVSAVDANDGPKPTPFDHYVNFTAYASNIRKIVKCASCQIRRCGECFPRHEWIDKSSKSSKRKRNPEEVEEQELSNPLSKWFKKAKTSNGSGSNAT